ncbi:MAG TPA: DNA topoisomerase I, partial [Acidobacteriota bacterium]|nr:DNA topoisomerase I [Acidobacteriota bacterium]
MAKKAAESAAPAKDEVSVEKSPKKAKKTVASEGSYELIITEKPSAAQKIAQALADRGAEKSHIGEVPFYELTHNGKPIKVACAVGHLYTVAEKDKSKGWTYPVFDLEWKPTSQVDKSADYTAKYVKAITQLAKEASEFTIATDYDIEGEVIGLNVILHACKQKDANRMKFSTLTTPDIVKAYENKSHTLDWGQALAGKTRHELDWYYGINLSRALSLAVRAAGAFKVLSSGRVQGPALKVLVDKEREIEAFIPTPYWELELHSAVKEAGKVVEIIAQHKEEKFTEEAKVDAILASIKDEKSGKVTNVSAKQFDQAPPTPFDLTTLQVECFRVHKIAPKSTLALAQELYIGGFISYPRTSSQKLPPELGYKKLIDALSKQPAYADLAKELLKKPTLKPNDGEKVDEAHPAIFPTGIVPAKLDGSQHKLYDLIVRRFLATFADKATRETMTVEISVKDQPFLTKGTRTVTKGWHTYYGEYASFEEVTLPALKVGEILPVKKIEKYAKQTKPPKRYTAASIIKELERLGLGTKSTRAAIVDNLYDRGYVNEKSIEATNLGKKTCQTLEKYCPRILDSELTRHFEDEMEEIRKKTKTEQQVLDHSKVILTEILSEFKLKEKDIGKELLAANRETQDAAATIGPCPTCKEGN